MQTKECRIKGEEIGVKRHHDRRLVISPTLERHRGAPLFIRVIIFPFIIFIIPNQFIQADALFA